MINVEEIFKILKKNKINFFAGVPDSILKNFSNYISNKKNHIITANEGGAISLGVGYYLSTNKIPCIYLQNSGLGNSINPLVSITHPKVYSIPMILIVGWRGSPGLKKQDESQHNVQGLITRKMLNLLNIKSCVIRTKNDLNKFNKLIKYCYKKSRPVVCLIERKTLLSKKIFNKEKTNKNSFKRRDLILELLKLIKKKTKIISTTGYTSRELFQIRKEEKLTNGKDFYMVGGMGHASMVSLGVSLYSDQETICLDGDGSLLMHLGSIRAIGFFAKKNFKHIVLNNNAHESVGGQTTTAATINFKYLAKSLGYKKFFKVKKKNKLTKSLKIFLKSKGPSFLEVVHDQGSIKNLLRPKQLSKIKSEFMLN